jgi:hypothetical protein
MPHATRFAERPGNMETGYAGGIRSVVQRDLIAKVTFHKPKRFSRRVHDPAMNPAAGLRLMIPALSCR